MKNLKVPWLLPLLLLLILSGCSQPKRLVSIDSPEFLKIVQTLESGKWVSENKSCRENHRIFRFNIKERKLVLYLVTPNEPGEKANTSYTYNILSANTHGFRGKIIGEERLDENDNPVEWDLLLEDERSYHWKRTDWPSYNRTIANIKCP